MEMMNRRKNSGSVLVWVAITSSILVIIVAAALTISYSYYNRSMNNNFAKQAYFTSRSVAKAVSLEIKNGTSKGNAIINMLNNPGDKVYLNNITLSDDSRYTGIVEAYAELTESYSIMVSATTTIAEQTKTVSYIVDEEYDRVFPIEDDFIELEVPNDVVMVSGSVAIDSSTMNDIYAASGSSVLFLNDADYHNTIYAESGITISINNGSKFDGVIYAQDGVKFSYSKLHNDFDGIIYVTNGSTININNRDYTFYEFFGYVFSFPSYRGDLADSIRIY